MAKTLNKINFLSTYVRFLDIFDNLNRGAIIILLKDFLHISGTRHSLSP